MAQMLSILLSERAEGPQLPSSNRDLVLRSDMRAAMKTKMEKKQIPHTKFLFGIRKTTPPCLS